MLKNFIKRFIKDEEGATAVEYAVMIVLIIVVCLGVITFLGQEVQQGFGNVANAINSAAGS